MTLAELEAYTLALEHRVNLLSRVLNDVQVAITNLATLDQLRQLNLIKQREMDEIQTDIETLQAELELVKGTVYK